MPDVIVLFIAMISFLYGGSVYLFNQRTTRKAYKKGVDDGLRMRRSSIDV